MCVEEFETDAQIVAASLTEPECFAQIYDRHSRSLHRFLVLRIGSDHGEELLGETFRTAFESRHRFDLTNPNARPWLFGIASNLVLKHNRKRRRRQRAIGRLGAQFEHRTAFEDRLVEISHASDLWDQIKAAIAELPERDREVILLYVIGELNYSEVADALGIPIGTVRSRIHRVRQNLRHAAEANARHDTYEEVGELRYE